MQEFYKIFKSCFPFIPVSEKVFEKKLSESRLFFRTEKNELIAFLISSGNSAELLCVRPDRQGMGYGTSLIEEYEDFLRTSGFQKVVLARSNIDFFRGAVMDSMSHRFFEKCGYYAFNGCLSMTMKLTNFSAEEIKIKYPYPDDIKFCVFTKNDIYDVIEAVKIVEPKWIKFFLSLDGEDILTAVRNGKIVGFMTLKYDADTIITDDYSKIGLLGYVGIIPSERNKNIGINMIACACEIFRKSGCTDVFINYTCLDEFYARAGFEDYLWYWMGEKDL